jgi:hypothetical protein
MSTGRAFAITFGCAVAVEVARLLFEPLGALDHVLFVLGYLVLALLGFLIAHRDRPYRSASALTLPFLVLWLALGMLYGMLEGTSAAWTAEDRRRAGLGYMIATLMFAPLAFLASALGVWLGRRLKGGRSEASNVR